jgi:hypothetical protein
LSILVTSVEEDLESSDGEGRRWRFQFREESEDRPASKVLELQGIRTLWVAFVIHKKENFPMDLEERQPISQMFRPAFAEAATRRQV